MPAPDRYIEWINSHLGFNPRSQANSNALSDFVLADLQNSCPEIAAHLNSRELAPEKNADVLTKVASRNVDFVLRDLARTTRASVEHKTVMTVHGKARWNRYGDIIAYCNHTHNHRKDCIAGATVIINCSPAYENPDAFAKGLVRPKFDMNKVVTDTAKIFAGIPLRSVADEPNDQPEALAVIIVDYDGQNPAKRVTNSLAPQPGSPIHYDNFIARVCELVAFMPTGYTPRTCARVAVEGKNIGPATTLTRQTRRNARSALITIHSFVLQQQSRTTILSVRF